MSLLSTNFLNTQLASFVFLRKLNLEFHGNRPPSYTQLEKVFIGYLEIDKLWATYIDCIDNLCFAMSQTLAINIWDKLFKT